MNGGHHKKRWKSRDDRAFHYTLANKPTKETRNTDQDFHTRETENQV